MSDLVIFDHDTQICNVLEFWKYVLDLVLMNKHINTKCKICDYLSIYLISRIFLTKICFITNDKNSGNKIRYRSVSEEKNV